MALSTTHSARTREDDPGPEHLVGPPRAVGTSMFGVHLLHVSAGLLLLLLSRIASRLGRIPSQYAASEHRLATSRSLVAIVAATSALSSCGWESRMAYFIVGGNRGEQTRLLSSERESCHVVLFARASDLGSVASRRRYASFRSATAPQAALASEPPASHACRAPFRPSVTLGGRCPAQVIFSLQCRRRTSGRLRPNVCRERWRFDMVSGETRRLGNTLWFTPSMVGWRHEPCKSGKHRQGGCDITTSRRSSGHLASHIANTALLCPTSHMWC